MHPLPPVQRSAHCLRWTRVGARGRDPGTDHPFGRSTGDHVGDQVAASKTDRRPAERSHRRSLAATVDVTWLVLRI